MTEEKTKCIIFWFYPMSSDSKHLHILYEHHMTKTNQVFKSGKAQHIVNITKFSFSSFKSSSF